MLVQEKHVEKALDFYEKYEGDLELILKEKLKVLPTLTNFVYSGNFSILSDEEKTNLEYLYLVIIKAVKSAGLSLIDPRPEFLMEKEDENWELMEEKKSNDFRKKLDLFFDQSEEEELMALLEDALEDEAITPVGKEVIFVGLKTIFDCLLEPHS